MLASLGASHCSPETLVRAFFSNGSDINSADYARVYVRQSLDSLLEAFLPWLDSQERVKSEPPSFARGYLKALRSQHAIAVKGSAKKPATSKKKTYRGYRSGWIVNDALLLPSTPGIFRTTPAKVLSTFLLDGKNKVVPLKRVRRFYMPSPNKILSHLEKSARALQHLIKTDDLSEEKFVDDLARFSYQFIASHPFPSVNKSICLSQLNVLLLRRGYFPIQHGFLDLLAYQLSEKSYRARFSHALDELTLVPGVENEAHRFTLRR